MARWSPASLQSQMATYTSVTLRPCLWTLAWHASTMGSATCGAPPAQAAECSAGQKYLCVGAWMSITSHNEERVKF